MTVTALVLVVCGMVLYAVDIALHYFIITTRLAAGLSPPYATNGF